jgi:hypothetical protein
VVVAAVVLMVTADLPKPELLVPVGVGVGREYLLVIVILVVVLPEKRGVELLQVRKEVEEEAVRVVMVVVVVLHVVLGLRQYQSA